MYNEEVTLISYKKTKDKLKNIIKTPVENIVLCRESSVGSSEFYQAAVNDLKPSIKIIIHEFEYSGEKEIIYFGNRYSVIRTFKGGAVKNVAFDEIELTCESVIGND